MADDETGDEEETLEILLSVLRSPETRSALRSNGAVAVTLARLSSSSPFLLFLPCLCFFRNPCAGVAANQLAFIASGDPDRVAAAILRSPVVQWIGLQLLGNAALVGEDDRVSVFFLDEFPELARVCGYRVLDPLCMVLDTCCSSHGGRERLEELCGVQRSLPLIMEIVSAASAGGYSTFGCLTKQPGDVTISNAFALNVLEVLKEASAVVDFSSRGNSALPTGYL